MATLSSESTSGKRSKRRPAASADTSKPGKSPRRWPRRLAIALAGYALLMWALPIVLAWTPLRDRAMAMALTGLNGTITSAGASLGWFSPVVFTDVAIHDPAGNLLVSAAAIRTDKTLLQLALSQIDLGTIRIEQPNLALEMRRDGSNAEDVLLPFLKSGNGGGPLTVALEFVDGTIALHDVPADRRWKIEQFQTSLRLEPKNPVPLECAISGNAMVNEKPAHFAIGYKAGKAGAVGSATASQTAAPAGAPVQIQAQIEPLPLEMFRPLVARVLSDAQVTGRLSADLQYQTTPSQPEPKTMLAGKVQVDGLNLSAAALGTDRLQLAVLQVPCQIVWQGRQIDVQQFGVTCDVGQLAINGQTALPDNLTTRSLNDWLHESFTVQGELDLAKLAKLLPETLHVRQDIRINSGDVKLALTSATNAGSHRWNGQLLASNITATSAGRPITWNQPITVSLAAHDAATGPVVEKLDCQSSFVHLTASGAPDQFTAQADCDLNRLATELGQFVDFGEVKPAGAGQAILDWQRSADGVFRAAANGRVTNLQVAMPGRTWTEPSLAATVSVAGQFATGGAARVDKASLDVTTGPAGAAGTDHLVVQLLEPANDATSHSLPGSWHVDASLQGDLGHWQARLSPWIPLTAWQLGGACDMSARVAYSAKGIDFQQAHAAVNRLHAWGGGWFIDEPAMQFDGAATWDSAARTLRLAPTTLTSNTIAIQTKETTLRLPTQGSPNLAGAVAWQADLARLTNWTHDPRTPRGSAATGRFSGQANLTETGVTTTAQLTAAVDDLAVYDGSASTVPAAPPARGLVPIAPASVAPFWQEKRFTIAAGGKYDRAADALSLDSFDVASTALHFKGSGKVAKFTGTQDVDLAGQMDYDWQTLGPLLRPYLGTQFQIAGRQSRQFSIRGPLAATVTPANNADTLAWLKPLVVEAGSGWSSASFRGIQFSAAQFDARLADGTVSIAKPLQLGLSEGQLTLSPRLRLSPGPAILMLDKGPLVQQVRLSQAMCSQWLKFVSPLASEAARAEGRFSIDLQGGRIPLADPTTCDVAGKLTIVSADINPGPIVHPFALLGRQVQAILKGQVPPLTAGSDRPLVHYPQQTVDFRVVNQRVYHDLIEMDVGGTTIRTHGSVGLLDESLIMEAEITLKTAPPLIGSSKPAAQPQIVTIPIEGTLGSPKIDPRAVEKLTAQLLKNSTRNTIREGIDKIDNLFRPNP